MGLRHFEHVDISRDPNLAANVIIADAGLSLS